MPHGFGVLVAGSQFIPGTQVARGVYVGWGSAVRVPQFWLGGQGSGVRVPGSQFMPGTQVAWGVRVASACGVLVGGRQLVFGAQVG